LPDSRYFELFGLAPQLNLDLKDLEQRYFSLSRQWHPDRFARKSEPERQEALDRTALLNDAYRTLRNPVKRAEYYIGSEGESPKPPPELLEEVFELNMALEELRSGDEEARPQLEQQHTRFIQMLADTDRELFGSEAPAQGRETEIRSLLNRRKYIQNLVRDVETTLHA